MATTYEPIATTTLGAASASITFSSIPATYTDIIVILSATMTAGSDLNIRFNSDTATNYSYTYLGGSGTNATSSGSINDTSIRLDQRSGTATNIPFFGKMDIFSYAGSYYKTVLINFNNDQNGAGSIDETVGLWRSTAAISTITLTAVSTTFKIGSMATLYGIKAA